MDNRMFCFQCEQTAGGVGCRGRAGVCGKSSDVAKLQDRLTGALIGLARSADGSRSPKDAHRLMIRGLFTTVTNVNFNEKTITKLIDEVHAEKEKYASAQEDYDMEMVWNADEDIRSLKSLILFGIRGMAAYAYHAGVLGYSDDEVNAFFVKALKAIGGDLGMDELLPIVLEVGQHNLACMELLDRANTETYGDPVPTEVPLRVEKGPFIVITGHDLYDLRQLLEQTKGKGINVYTHGEMLPAHGYPELKKYPHLKGNFGTRGRISRESSQISRLPSCSPPTASCPRRRATATEYLPPRSCHIPRSYISARTRISLP
jgi:hydroxylamine reductase